MNNVDLAYGDIKKYKRKRRFEKFLHYLVMLIPILFFVIIIYPFIWLVISSFKTTNEIFSNIWGFPGKWQFVNYLNAWKSGISSYFLNSVIVTVCTCILNLVVSCMYAFALNAFRMKHKGIFYLLGISGLMFSPIVSLIPLYQEIQAIKLYDSLLGLILIYTAYQMSMSIMIINTTFASVDKSFLEAAKIDGCSNIGILWNVYLPLSKPTILTSIVLTAFYAWNEFSFALTFLKTKSKMTIPIGLITFQGEMHTEWSVLLAGLVISAIPIIVFYIFTQKYFVSGLSAGGVKG